MKVVIAVALMVLVGSVVTRGAIEEQYKEGPISISAQKPGSSGGESVIMTGEKVTFRIAPCSKEHLGQSTIIPGAVASNSLPIAVRAVYAISFQDKDGKMVTCGQGSFDVKPNQLLNYGSGILYATPEAIARIVSYKLRTQVTESTRK
jgi:hypothetical protein